MAKSSLILESAARILGNVRAFASLDSTEDRIDRGTYYVSAYKRTGIGNGATSDAVFTTPAEPKIAARFRGVLGGTGELSLYEGSTGFTGGTAIPSRNKNRNRGDNATATVLADSTAGTLGTLLGDLTFGAGSEIVVGGSSDSYFNKWELLPSTSYTVRFTNTSGGQANISFIFEWFEED